MEMPFLMTDILYILQETDKMTQMVPGLLGLEDEPRRERWIRMASWQLKQVPWILPLKLKVGLMSLLRVKVPDTEPDNFSSIRRTHIEKEEN